MKLKSILTVSSVITTLLLTPQMELSEGKVEEEPPAIESVVVKTQEKLETAGLIGTRLPFLGEYDIVFEESETLTEENEELQMSVSELKKNLKKLKKSKKSVDDKVDSLEKEVQELKSINSSLNSKVNELSNQKEAKVTVDKTPKQVAKATIVKKEPKNEVSKSTDKKQEVKESNAKESTPPQKPQQATGGGQTFEATYYGMDCSGCSGTTASGLTLSSGQTTYQGMRVIAVDPRVIPFHSVVQITHNGSTYTAVAKDSGGAIKGNRIDILTGSEAESAKHGRHSVQIKVISRGNGAYKRE